MGVPPTLVQPVRQGPPLMPAPSVQFPGAPGAPLAGPDRVATGATRVLPSDAGSPPFGVPASAQTFPGSPGFGGPAVGGRVAPPSASSTGANKVTDKGKKAKRDSDGRSFFRRPLFLIALAVVVLGGLGSLVYYLFFRPAPIYLDPVVVTIALPTPATSPASTDIGSDFAAALPNQTLTYGLTTIEDVPSTAHLPWQGRTVEHWMLTYEDGSGSDMTVIALQYYHENDAVAAFESAVAAEEAAANTPIVSASPSSEPSPSASAPAALLTTLTRSPVIAGGVQVGESVRVLTTITEGANDDGTGGTTRQLAKIIWRNSTGVFVMTADPDVIDDLFLEYGV